MRETFQERERLWGLHSLRDMGKKAMGMMGILSIGFMPAGSSQDFLAGKPEGPYTWLAPDTPSKGPPIVHKEAYISKQIQAIHFDDDFDGLLVSEGFTLGYDNSKLVHSLPGDEAVIITQTAYIKGKEPFTEGAVVRSDHADESVWDVENAARRRLFFPHADYAVSVGEYNLSPQLKKQGYESFGFGIGSAEQDATSIKIETYKLYKDGSYKLLTEQETTARLVANEACEQDEHRKITSEVRLTSVQHDLMCQAVARYGRFLPDDARVILNSVGNEEFMTDSFNYISDRVTFTFPYIGKDQIPDDLFLRTALHEMLHGAYHRIDPGSRLMYDVATTYQDMLKQTKYQVPSPLKLDESKIKVPEVEPVWELLTEGEYAGGDHYGHPWENATEMISSAASVLAFYPDQFMQKYVRLDKAQQRAVREVVRTVSEVIETYDYNVVDIIPEYARIQQELKRSK